MHTQNDKIDDILFYFTYFQVKYYKIKKSSFFKKNYPKSKLNKQIKTIRVIIMTYMNCVYIYIYNMNVYWVH